VSSSLSRAVVMIILPLAAVDRRCRSMEALSRKMIA
jgi:hypothetical protein